MNDAGTSRVTLAHAKVNLMLRILAREASGYHAIETLFQRLALHDVVRVDVGADVRDRTLECTGAALPNGGLGVPESNLAWKAAEAFVAASRWETGWRIVIEKRIPVGGGLGGGSTDAAAVLQSMNAMAPTPLDGATLLEIAGTLGADVPFFLTGASLAFGWGRGDRLLILPPLPVMPVTLFTFTNGVNTGTAYREVARAREHLGASVRARAYDVDAFSSWAAIGAIASNDFEDAVAGMHAGVGEVLPMIRAAVRGGDADAADAAEAHASHTSHTSHTSHAQSAQGARAIPLRAIRMLSGSGATCFALPGINPMPPAWDRRSASVVQTQTL